MTRPPRLLAIGGSDSGGGAGIQADIKTIAALGGYAATAITAVTVQNTLGVHDSLPLPAGLVEAQARAVLDDIGADAIKIGMVGEAGTALALAGVLADFPTLPVVVDPVMIAKGGAPLLGESALDALRRLLVPLATLLTPNAPEAEILTGGAVISVDDLRRAGETLLRLGAKAVLMKGGHIGGDQIVDILIHPGGERRFEHRRAATRHTHGTGCTLASACAVGLATGLALDEAVGVAIDYTQRAIAAAPGLGAGHGPLGHGAAAR